MASRYRSLSRPAFNFLKSSLPKPPSSSPSLLPRSSPFLSRHRPVAQLVSLQSLLPFHTAVSSARLTSCLGMDSRSSRSLSQEMGLSVPR